ncbi:MAG: hypothetical protein JWO14_966, partial [Solirubrobacterales bacterium]|nr:hypothetical protein [Solirubrobacterales bacterium]
AGTSPLLFRRGFPGSLPLRRPRSYARSMPTPPEIVYMPGGTRTEIHLDGTDTSGAFCLLVDNPPRPSPIGPRPPTPRSATAGASSTDVPRFSTS